VSTTLNAKTAGVQLLTALAQLMNLRKLNLTNIMLNDVGDYSGAVQPDGVVPGRLSPFSALTASSHLESLVLAYTDTHKGDRPIQPLPQGAVAVMFPPGRQLNALTGDALVLQWQSGCIVYATNMLLTCYSQPAAIGLECIHMYVCHFMFA
jgi:hypothetical protein